MHVYIIGELSMFWSGITCDGCGQQLAYANIMPKNRLIVLARQEKWSIGKYHLCPSCKKKMKELIEGGYLKQ